MTDRRENTGLVRAFQGLTEGLVQLFQQHLELFGLELKHDATVAGRYASAFVFYVAISLLGYALLNIAAILFAGVAAGVLGMAICASALAIINLGMASHAMLVTFERMKASGIGPKIAGGELDRSKTWAKQIQTKDS